MEMIAIIVVLSLVIAFLICQMFKNEMQTAQLRREAGHYVESEELNLRVCQDVFSHVTETRQQIERDKR